MMPYMRSGSLIDAHVSRSKSQAKIRTVICMGTSLLIILLQYSTMSRQPEGNSVMSPVMNPVMKIDPADGNAYDKASFLQEYGGTTEWDAAQFAPGSGPSPSPASSAGVLNSAKDEGSEGDQIPISAPDKPVMKIDPADGNAYDKASFLQEYGGTTEWDAAQFAPGSGPSPSPASSAGVLNSANTQGSQDKAPAKPDWWQRATKPSADQALKNTGWMSQPQLRIDQSDGKSYDMQSFKDVYGKDWQEKWTSSAPDDTIWMQTQPTLPPPSPPPPVPPSRSSELMQMIMRHDTVHAKEMLDNGADPNEQNKFGFSALMFAAWKGNAEAVRDLLAAGAKLDLTNRAGKTALMLAAKASKIEVVEILTNAKRAQTAETAQQSGAGLEQTPPLPPVTQTPPPAPVIEKRIDESDGQAYEKQSFIDVYGGTAEWDTARPA